MITEFRYDGFEITVTFASGRTVKGYVGGLFDGFHKHAAFFGFLIAQLEMSINGTDVIKFRGLTFEEKWALKEALAKSIKLGSYITNREGKSK